MSQEKSHIITMLVENEFGVLARIAGLFSSKGYNIDSLTVSDTTDPTLSRMTIVTHGSPQIIEQINKQLKKLIDTVCVEDLTHLPHVERELVLVKLAAVTAEDLKSVLQDSFYRLIEENPKTLILELSGSVEELKDVLSRLRKFTILETVRSGKIAMHRDLGKLQS